MGLLRKLFLKSDDQTGDPAAAPRWTVRSAAEILRHFPIGSKVLYAPEAKRELRLESILLGYDINGHLVYSRNELSREIGASRAVLRVHRGGEDLALEEIKSFHMLIPHQPRSEIDFPPLGKDEPESKLVQKRVNDFERGAWVTLICYSPYGKVPNIGTLVTSTRTLAAGPYANHRVVILDPVPNTLSYADKRRHQRLRTNLPIHVQLSLEGGRVPCVLEDSSERFLRVRMPAEEVEARGVSAGEPIFLALELTPGADTVLLQGLVFRRRTESLVVELKAIWKAGRFSDFQLVDQLELKSALLHHASAERLRSPAEA
jgi:hypothetical protein